MTVTSPTPPTWDDILIEPWTALILGSRGSGKTALGHRLLELWGDPTHTDDPRDAYIMGLPEDVEAQLPAWIRRLPTNTAMEAWPEDSIVLLHEAHHILHARRSMDAENLEIDKLLTVSRHKNSCVIVETQQSQRLDRNAVTAVDAVIVRQPALLQTEFERKGMRKVISRAEDVFQQYTTDISDEEADWTFRRQDPAAKKAAYVYSERFEGAYPHEIELAEHYTDEISTAYGGTVGVIEEAERDSTSSERAELADNERTALNAVAEWEIENRPLSFEHKGATHDTIPLQHAWNPLSALHGKQLLKKTYNANNSPTQYRLTDEGWKKSDHEEPSTPEVETE
jgi:hypothetical protein